MKIRWANLIVIICGLIELIGIIIFKQSSNYPAIFWIVMTIVWCRLAWIFENDYENLRLQITKPSVLSGGKSEKARSNKKIRKRNI